MRWSNPECMNKQGECREEGEGPQARYGLSGTDSCAKDCNTSYMIASEQAGFFMRSPP